jgi:hypothetical protein
MATSDPQAVWVYQSYPWHQFIYYHKAVPGGGDPITLTRSLSKAWTSAVPKTKLLLLDLWADAGPLWNLLDSFFGHDFIWCMLHSFGGNDGMWADLRTVSREATAKAILQLLLNCLWLGIIKLRHALQITKVSILTGCCLWSTAGARAAELRAGLASGVCDHTRRHQSELDCLRNDARDTVARAATVRLSALVLGPTLC